MNTELLQKYISGNATEAEKQHVTKWMQESPENMREYMAQRKLYDIALWRTAPIAEEKRQPKKIFSLRTLWIEAAKIAAIFAVILDTFRYHHSAETGRNHGLVNRYHHFGSQL